MLLNYVFNALSICVQCISKMCLKYFNYTLMLLNYVFNAPLISV